jgi:hypothetical protein
VRDLWRHESFSLSFDFILIDLPCDRTGDGDFDDRLSGMSADERKRWEVSKAWNIFYVNILEVEVEKGTSSRVGKIKSFHAHVTI